jgi:hypothetical protein
MKRISNGAFAKRGLFTVAMVVILCGAGVTTSGSLLAQEVSPHTDSPGHPTNVFFTTSAFGPNGADVFAIEVSGSHTTTRHIGATFGGDCATLALSPSGTLYSMCGSLFANSSSPPSTRDLDAQTCSA